MVDILREVSRGMEGESYRTDGILLKEAILYWIRKDTGSQ